MTRNTRPLIIICPFIQLLAFLLICQTVREIEGQSTNRDSQRPRLLYSTKIRKTRNSDEESWKSQDMTKLLDRNQELSHLDSDSIQDTNTNTRRRRQGSTTFESQDTDDMTMSNDGFVFPNDEIVSTRNRERPQIPQPPTCIGGFCEKVPQYPRELIDRIIGQINNSNFLENIDEFEFSDVGVIQRMGDEDSLCTSVERLIFPQTAENKNREWLFVINQENLKQGIRIEVCINEGKECNIISGFAENYKTECKQKYIYRTLSAIANNGTIIKDLFRFAASCCCSVKSTFPD